MNISHWLRRLLTYPYDKPLKREVLTKVHDAQGRHVYTKSNYTEADVKRFNARLRPRWLLFLLRSWLRRHIRPRCLRKLFPY